MYINWKNGIPYDKNGDELQFLSPTEVNELHYHLDTLEEYEQQSAEIDLANLYDLYDECPSVYATSNDNEKYLHSWAKKVKFFKNPELVSHYLTKGIQEKDFDTDIIPLIPILEYKLVPTGNVVYYDPSLTEYERRKQLAKEKELRKKTERTKRSLKKKLEEMKRGKHEQ